MIIDGLVRLAEAIGVGPEQDNAPQGDAAELTRFIGLRMPFCTVKSAV
jgi:hypothetical protein